MTPLKVKKLNPKAVLPIQATDGSAGLDLTAITEDKPYFVGDMLVVTYGTGIAIEIPKGYVGLIFPRSSLSTKKTLMLGNAVGVIDSDYRGEIKFVFKEMNKLGKGKKYELGDRIGQLIVMPLLQVKIEEVNELTPTKRDDGGYGSTGK